MTAAADQQRHESLSGGAGPPHVSRDARLFSVQERWGWQYVPAVAPRSSPLSDARPEWVEPPPPKMTHLERQLGDTRQRLGQAVMSGALFVVFGLVAFALLGGTPGVGVTLVLIGGALFGHRVVKVQRARQAIARTKRQRAADRDRKWADYQRRLHAWEDAIGRHNTDEQLRFASQPVWYPVLPSRSQRRVDVCGGTADGWASLLTTCGASLLAAGARPLLLDLTGDDVGVELRALATRAGYRSALTQVRCSGTGADVFAGLTAADVVDALALSIREATGNVDDQQAESHALDSEVLDLAISCLDAPYSVGRVVAALTFLARPHDVDAARRLGEPELQRLATNTDTIVTDTELRRRLSVILARLRPLRDMEIDHERRALFRLDGAPDLLCVTMERGTHTQATALRRLLFNTLALRLKSVSGNGRVLFVAGCDEVSHMSLETMSRLATRSGVRLVMMFQHLRGAALRVLGGDGSATLFMRLGNTDEASAAAEYVGKEHKLVLSQVTHSVGETLTDTAGTSDTWQEGISDTSSTSRGTTTNDGLISRTSRNTGTSEGVSTSRSYAWGQTRSLAQAVTAQSGQTMARSYEFTVEPTRFQSLPQTAFIAVARNGYDNLVVAADCNPGIVDLDRVASEPYGP
jgi:hypothetical protein